MNKHITHNATLFFKINCKLKGTKFEWRDFSIAVSKVHGPQAFLFLYNKQVEEEKYHHIKIKEEDELLTFSLKVQ